jgi:hypothetical protein
MEPLKIINVSVKTWKLQKAYRQHALMILQWIYIKPLRGISKGIMSKLIELKILIRN